MTTETETDWAAKIGQPAYESIVDMVAALECDYDRLEELREAQSDWDNGEGADHGKWIDNNHDEAEELAELEAAAGECESQDDAHTRIMEDPLDLRVFGERRNGEWEADRFELLLGTGGPAVRIVGEIDQHGEPDRARLEVQDWFKPWTEYVPADQDVLLTYARQFVYVS